MTPFRIFDACPEAQQKFGGKDFDREDFEEIERLAIFPRMSSTQLMMVAMTFKAITVIKVQSMTRERPANLSSATGRSNTR